MNQILDYNPGNKTSGGSSGGTDKIVRVLAIILAIFAIGFLGIGGYTYYKNTHTVVEEVQAPTDAQISTEINEDENTVTIKVSHDKVIEKIVYCWNEGKETTEKVSGESVKEVTIPLPSGENTLIVKVVDSVDHETLYKQPITSESGTDIIKPTVTVEPTEDGKVKITAEDDKEISYVTYCWNGGETNRVDVEEDEDGNKTKIEFEIDIEHGTNDLTVVAVDANNLSTTNTKTFSGVLKPTVTVTVAEDHKSINVLCSHENGLQSVSLKINDGEEQNVNWGEGTPPEIQFDYAVETSCTITIKAVSVDQTVTEKSIDIVQETEDEIMDIQINKDEETNQAQVNVGYENGISNIHLVVAISGNTVYDSDIEGVDGTQTALDFKFNLGSGTNEITVEVTGADGLTDSKTVELEG